MKQKVLTGSIAVLFCAGAYFQESGLARARNAQDPDQPPVSRRIERAIALAISRFREEGSPLTRIRMEQRKDFNHIVYDPLVATSSIGGAATNRVEEGASQALQFISHSQVQGEGEVVVILGDSVTNTTPQKFMVRMSSGKMLLIEHNTEVAPPVESLELGDEVVFCGEYTYDIDGDVVRWTHKDPAARHVAGWIRHNGRTYQ